MKFANATNLNRKSGAAKWRDLRFSHPLRSCSMMIFEVLSLRQATRKARFLGEARRERLFSMHNENATQEGAQ